MENDKKLALLSHKKLAKIIKQAGMTQEEFAEELGISDRHVRNLISEDKDVSISLAYNISKLSNQSIEDLLTITYNINQCNQNYKAHFFNIAHLVKNNMQSVRGLLQLLERKCEINNIEIKSLQPIYQEITATINLINAFLQNSSAEPNITTCSVNDLILEIVKTQKFRFNSHKIQLETRLASKLPSIKLDKQLITQVLLSCLDNSLTAILQKHTQDGKILICTEFDTLHKKVRLKLKDNGIGLTPEQQNHFFEPYYTTKTTGNGLGTSINQTIIKVHGGKISVEGTQGAGCCICIELPVNYDTDFSRDDVYNKIASMIF